MKFKKKLLSSVIFAGLLFSGLASADSVAEGKKIAVDRKLGNCLTCHVIIGGGTLPGNIGPPLVGIKGRFTKQELNARLWDPTIISKDTTMPPFGKHGILSKEQIKKVVDYIYTL